MACEEKTPLTSYRLEYSDKYESITRANGNLILYCCHGKRAPQNCCKDDCETCLGKMSENKPNHCHPSRDSGVDKIARRRLIFASILCLIFMVGEIVGGLLANSLAIATDAAHLLTDFASFMISLSSLWIASRPATKTHPFGFHRAEVIGALTSVLLIWVVTGILVYMAVQRIISGDYEIDATIMLITAGVGVLVNIIMGISLQLGGVPHGHSHGGASDKSHSHGGASDKSHSHGSSSDKSHSHGSTTKENELGITDPTNKLAHARGKGNINVRAAFIHVVGDFIQSLGVFIAALIIFFKPDLVIVDPICTFLFSVLVLFTTITIMREVLNVLMEGIPKSIDFLEVQRVMFGVSGVIKVHNLRIWSLSMDKIALCAHIVVREGENATAILQKVSREIRERYDIYELTLQVEEYKEDMQNCNQCQDPTG